jgi:hypothetical protein
MTASFRCTKHRHRSSYGIKDLHLRLGLLDSPEESSGLGD